MATMSPNSAQDLAHRKNAAAAAEKAQSARLLGAKHIPFKSKKLAITAIHASLLYAAATWETLTTQQMEAFSVAYVSPVRRAVGGAWCPKQNVKPMARREAMTKAEVLWPETAILLARLRSLPRLVKAPVTLLALLQTPAAAEWQQTMKDDLNAMRAHLPKLLKALPSPNEDPVPWLRLVYDFSQTMEATDEARSQGSIGGASRHLYAGLQGSR